MIVGVAGGSGSGKTLFIKKLINDLPNVAVHSMDNYYTTIQDQPLDSEGVENFDTPASINQQKFIEDLNKLINGETIEIQKYTYNNSEAAPQILRIKSESIILVEGIFTLYLKDIRDLLDLKIYIETPDFLMLKRRIIRDAEERGYDLQDVLYRFEHHVTPSFEQYILPSKKWADIIIPNHNDFNTALKVVSSFLKQ